MEDFGFKLMMTLFVTFCLGLLALMCYAIYDSMTAETFALRKDSWACTKSHEEQYTTTTKVGDIDVPVINTDVVCDQWSKK